MNKHLLTCILATLFVCGATSLSAKPRTTEQAQQLAAQYLSSKHIKRALPGHSEFKTTAVFNALDKDAQPYLYAVSEQNSFVLVSGDDRFAPVLGYSDNGSFNEQNMPENMRAWLQGYIDEMNYLNSINYQPSAVTATNEVKQSIAPMVTTKWNQGDPYNGLCPLDGSNRSVTGCAATAMAQVVNYHMQNHNAPTAIKEAIEAYTTKSRQLSVSGVAAGTALPNKSLLLNTYGEDATDAQKTAVAQLMLYCGTSIQMDYTSGGSGAYTADAQYALVRNFGFDETVQAISRSEVSYARWIDLVYNELKQSRPVIYSGHSSGGGHAFVADGYDSGDLFHINWGWGGSSDGYFALSVLNPDDDGQIGASASGDGYSSDQLIVIGIQINSGQTPTPKPVCMAMYLTKVENKTVTYSTWNETDATHSFDYGIGTIDNDGNITPVATSSVNDLKPGFGFSVRTHDVPTNTAYANSKKKIVLISREKNTNTWYVGANADIYYLTAVYDANGVPTLTMHPAVDWQAGAITVGPSKCANETQKVKMQLLNKGDEFYGTLYFFASKTSDKTRITSLGLTALPNSTHNLSFDWKPTETGTYNLWITTDWNGNDIIATGSVVIKEDQFLTSKDIAITELAFDAMDANSWQYDETTGIFSADVYTNVLSGTISVTNRTNSDIAEFRPIIVIEEYNEQAGTYTSVASPGWNAKTLYANYTRKLGLGGRTVDYNKTYRIHLMAGTSSPFTSVDTRYYVHTKAPKTALKDANITLPAIADQQYTGTTIEPTFTVMAGTKNITSQCEFSYINNINVGTAIVNISAKESSSEYSGALNTTFTITKAPLTITAQNATIVWGDAKPTFTVSYDGWLGNDCEFDLEQNIAYECAYNQGDNVGEYTITPYGTTARNYNITFVPATLTVNKADAVISVAPRAITNIVYDGTPKTLITAGTAVGGTMLYSLDNITWDPALPVATEIGEYTVYYRVEADSNHNDNPGGSLIATIIDTSDINNVNHQSSIINQKLIKDGQLFIRRGNKIYNAQGARVK